MTSIIVITGWDRSGSTIIASALGSVAGVETVGEITNLWRRGFGENRACACGEPFSNCGFWRPVAQKAFGDEVDGISARAEQAMERLGNLLLAQRQLRGSAGAFDVSGDYGRLLSTIYGAAADHSGAAVLVDSSKKPWHTAVAMGLAAFDVYVLHVVRDPRGVAFSFRKRVRYEGDDLEMDRHGPTFSSLAWLYRNWLTESEWSESPNYLRVRYEDFVADPTVELQRILTWAGVEAPLPMNAEGALVITPSHNISGNPSRFRHGATQLRLDDAWRTEMDPPVRRYVSALTAIQRRRYGYR